MHGTYSIARGELVRTFSDYEIVHTSEGEIAEIVARRVKYGQTRKLYLSPAHLK